MTPELGQQRLAELAWDRYMTAIKDEGQERRSAFIDIVKFILTQQDQAWIDSKTGPQEEKS
jgi:hypothetical protein